MPPYCSPHFISTTCCCYPVLNCMVRELVQRYAPSSGGLTTNSSPDSAMNASWIDSFIPTLKDTVVFTASRPPISENVNIHLSLKHHHPLLDFLPLLKTTTETMMRNTTCDLHESRLPDC